MPSLVLNADYSASLTDEACNEKQHKRLKK